MARAGFTSGLAGNSTSPKGSARAGVSRITGTIMLSRPCITDICRGDLGMTQIVKRDANRSRALRCPAVVDFDHADAGAVVKSREQRGIRARW